MTIFYEVHGGLYVNLTNRCPCSCTFCLRQTRDHMENSGPLWLEHEPTAEEIDAALAEFDLNKYKEVVFCGFGEPTERLDALLETAKKIRAKKADVKIRINTNGLGDLIHQKSIAPQLDVAKNLFIGNLPMKGGLVDHKALYSRAAEILAELEAGAAPAPVPRAQAQEDTQVSMMDLTGQQVAAALRAISVENLTPIEAMNELYKLRKMLD